MTEFNQRVSAITREVVERGEPISVTNRGKVVLRLVPEPTSVGDPLASLIAAGRAAPPRSDQFQPLPEVPISTTRPLGELLADERDDGRV